SMLLDSLDTRHDPCDDFYKFTCGKWAEAHLAQSNTNSWFSDRTRYLSSKMENKLDELGLEPMFSVLERVGLPKTLPDENSGVTFSISKTLARIQRVLSMDLLVQLSMALDPKTNKTIMVVSPTPGGPSLPELISSDDADDGGHRPAAAVSSREALGLRLAYMTGVMAAIQPQANVSELGTAALKILVIDSQIRSFDWNEYVTVLLDGLGVEFSGNDTLYVAMPDYFALLGARLHRSRPESFPNFKISRLACLSCEQAPSPSCRVTSRREVHAGRYHRRVQPIGQFVTLDGRHDEGQSCQKSESHKKLHWLPRLATSPWAARRSLQRCKDYDETGRRVSWWDSEMTKAYDERAQCFVKQYDKFGFTANYSLNGTLTLAENIADNGGLREAFHAYEHFVDRNGQEPKLPGLEGYDHKQLFFIAFTNVWCEKSNLQDDISSLNDVHSPNKFRVLGTLRNLEEFSRVWNCPAGSNMNPKGKCVLW
ncbi:unnamed protein product, partial [Nesidiocoris tenuis]